jgi:hypothetical protein
MPDILRPDKNSQENILLFINTIEDTELRQLVLDNLAHILAVGAEQDQNRDHRTAFFQAIERLIEARSAAEA